jgi:phosphatidate cytidylyltransferase
VALYEYFRLTTAAGFYCFRWSGIGGGVLLSLFFLHRRPEFSGVAPALVFVAFFLQAIFSTGELKRSLEGAAVTFTGVFYIAYFLGHLVWLRGMMSGADLVLFCLVLLWANDTGAYYVGSRYGVTKMAPVLSPGKTWEGFFGGFILTLAAAWIGIKFLPAYRPKAALVLAGFISFLGPVGDLIESMIKRAAGKKDSGTLIPGHGGLLDRIDSLIVCAPFIYYYCRSLF